MYALFLDPLQISKGSKINKKNILITLKTRDLDTFIY
jgi:hypothetical protein